MKPQKACPTDEDERFVYDAYRRLIQMFGSVVMGIPDEHLKK